MDNAVLAVVSDNSKRAEELAPSDFELMALEEVRAPGSGCLEWLSDVALPVRGGNHQIAAPPSHPAVHWQPGCDEPPPPHSSNTAALNLDLCVVQVMEEYGALVVDGELRKGYRFKMMVRGQRLRAACLLGGRGQLGCSCKA